MGNVDATWHFAVIAIRISKDDLYGGQKVNNILSDMKFRLHSEKLKNVAMIITRFSLVLFD